MSILPNLFAEVLEELHGACDTPPAKPRPRKPRARPQRRIRLVHPVQETTPGHVIIMVGKRAVDFTLERIASPLGDAFKLTKCSPVPEGEEPEFHVLLADDGHSCHCKGFLRFDRCNHVEGLMALKAAGKL